VRITLILIFLCLSSAHSIYKSESYKISLIEGVNISNSGLKESFSYSLLSNTSALGVLDLTGPRYSSNPGILNLLQPPQTDVKTAHVYPNPCNIKKGCNNITFVRLTSKCQMRIFSISGEEIKVIDKNSDINSIGWDLKNKNGNYVSSGLYLFYIKDSQGSTKTGKIVIIR